MAIGPEALNDLPPRFIPTQFGSYSMVEWSGSNTSGLRALCDKVVVFPDQVPNMTEGGIIFPDSIKESLGASATTGILVSVGPQAFAYDSDRLVKWVGERPKAGDRVYFQKYVGQEHSGRDGMLYRIMQDKSIACIEEPPGIADYPNRDPAIAAG
jgi:co-chaperonin GroES (HSP10)